MSSDAIRDVTKAVRALLLAQMPAGRRVTLLPPGENPPANDTGVNLYMYRISEHPQFKNLPWPGDRSGTPPRDEPVLSIELLYLLTPFAKPPQPTDPDDPAHRALGEAMLVLHENPVLNRIHAPSFDADAQLPTYLASSYEEIKIRLHPITLDELARIWGTIGKPYRLSVAYAVTLVQLVPAPRPEPIPGIVQRTEVDVEPIGPPRLLSLEPPSGAVATLTAGAVKPATLTLAGFGFTFPGEEPRVLVGDAEATIVAAPTARSLQAELPLAIPAGPQIEVRVRINRRSSVPIVFIASPWAAQLTPIRTALDPAVPADLRLTITGEGLATAAQVRAEGAGSWQAVPLAGDASTVLVNTPAAANANLAGAGAKNGLYDVRVRLSTGALTNARSLEIIPQLNGIAGTAANSRYVSASRTLTLNGRRLDGQDVRVLMDDAEYRLGAVGGAGTQIVHTFATPLRPGAHSVAVNVDGHVSREIVFTI